MYLKGGILASRSAVLRNPEPADVLDARSFSLATIASIQT